MKKEKGMEAYLDNSATTKCYEEVKDIVIKTMMEDYGNPSSKHIKGMEAEKYLRESRELIAKTLKVNEKEIFFTSGGTESDNWALIGTAMANRRAGQHIITTAIEHAAVLQPMLYLQEQGFEITFLPVDETGLISLEELKEALREDTILVSIMYVNNEVGAINPVNDIGAYIKYHTDAYFQVDATQALGKLPIDLKDIDMMSFSAHKIEGLKGSGILVKKKHIPMIPLINGGQQEDGIRGGTSNALVNICFAKTLRLSLENQHKYHDHIHMLHEHLLDELLKIDGIVINSKKISVDSIVNFSVAALTSEVMLNALNSRNIMVSALSTCHSKLNTSHVLTSMKYDDNRIKHSLRVSFDYHTTMDDIDYFITNLKEIIKIYG